MIFVVVMSVLVILLVIGLPVHIALGASALLVLVSQGVPVVAAANTIIWGINSFPLIAIPFFIFAGLLMNETGVTERIFQFARAAIGWAPGGLGHVNVGSSVIFAGMSGAAVADAGGLGAIEIKAMGDAGYPKDFAVGITAASSVIGPIIPPSLPLIIYGVMAETSIRGLFMAGVVPGLLMAASLMIMVTYYSVRHGYPRDQRFNLYRLLAAFRQACVPLLCPVLIIGGIVSGVFTPTEAAAAAVMLVLFIGVVVYRSLTVSSVLKCMLETVKTTSSVLLIVASAALFAWMLTVNQVAEDISVYFQSMGESPATILFLIIAISLFMGLFMETIAAITILVPICLPVALEAGIDPILVGVLMVISLVIGLLTPPVGMVLYVLSKVSREPYESCVKATTPFLVSLLAILALLVVFPELVLWLPNRLAN